MSSSVRTGGSHACGRSPAATAAIAGHFVSQDADDKHRESTDKQEEILAELRRAHERLERLEAQH
jgi:hypothetical protein